MKSQQKLTIGITTPKLAPKIIPNFVCIKGAQLDLRIGMGIK